MKDPDGFDARWLGAIIAKEDWHFHRQLLERYGIVLMPGEYSFIRKSIRIGRAQMVEKRHGAAAIYSVRIPRAGTRIFVLAVNDRPTTAWPPESRLNKLRRKLAIPS